MLEHLVKEGKLHEFDYDWIKNLPPEQQMQAARKVMRNFNVTLTVHSKPKSIFSAKGYEDK